MRILPDGHDLLSLARQTVLDELLPLLPESKKYTARMVANAIAISQRQLIAGEQALRDQLIRINEWEVAALLPPSTNIADAWRGLSNAIDNGRLDGDAVQNVAARELLWQLTLSRLHYSAPKALKGLATTKR